MSEVMVVACFFVNCAFRPSLLIVDVVLCLYCFAAVKLNSLNHQPSQILNNDGLHDI